MLLEIVLPFVTQCTNYKRQFTDALPMLLFREAHKKPILERRKTETRRLWPNGVRVKVGSTHLAKLRMFDSGSAFARILITEVHQERLGDIDQESATSEGYPSVQSYLRAFARINALDSKPEEELREMLVWRVKFKLVEAVG